MWNNAGSAWATTPGGEAFAFAGGAVPSVVEISVPLANLGNPSAVELAAWCTGAGGSDNAQDIVPSSNGNATDWVAQSNIANFETHGITAASVENWELYL